MTGTARAGAGECTKNPTYMTGGSGGPGQCRLACGECEPCDEADTACAAESRRVQGYLPDLEGEFEELFPGSRILGAAEQEAEERETERMLSED